jgi:hypothetical protein
MNDIKYSNIYLLILQPHNYPNVSSDGQTAKVKNKMSPKIWDDKFIITEINGI